MQYNPPYGTDPAGNSPYINGNPSTGTSGSIPPAASIEYPQREIVNLITDAGLVPDNADLHQVGKSVQSGRLVYGVDSGAANILSIALTPPLAAYTDGLFVWVRVAVSNTGPSVLSINGLAGKNIVRRGGTALQPGDLPGGYLALLVYNGPHGNFELYGASFAPATFVPILGANTNLYVNGTTGDDALYDGSAAAVAAPHGPFKTIGRAITETFKYGPSVYTMTINVAAGTYPEAVSTPNVIGPTTIIKGIATASVFVTGGNNAHTFQSTSANQLYVQNVTVSTGTGTGPPCGFSASAGSLVSTSNTASGFISGAVWNSNGGYLNIGSHTFNVGGSMAYAIWINFGGFGGFQAGSAMTFAGSTAISGAFINCGNNGSFEVPNPGVTTFANPAFVAGSGLKFLAAYNGVINTQGQGINYFPGVNPGLRDALTGGQYQ